MMKGLVDRLVMAVLDVLTFAGCVLGAWQLWESLKPGTLDAAAAGAAVAIALVAIPYALSGMFHRVLVRQRWRSEDA